MPVEAENWAAANRFLWMVSSLVSAMLTVPNASASHEGLPAQAKAVLSQKCAQCHGITRVSGTLDIRNPKTFIDDKKAGYVTPGSAEKSYIWTRISNGDMPPDKELSSEEKAIIKKWIDNGAESFPESPLVLARPAVRTLDVLKAIRNHLLETDPEDRPFMRYFTLEHLHNDESVDSERLSRHRAALSKAINSMHWKSSIVVPKQVDQHGAVYGVDLRDLGWEKASGEKNDRWAEMMKRYPYGLANRNPEDPAVEKLDADLLELGGGFPVVMRADWFVARATRPPLYELVLRLPQNVAELEAKIGVEANENIAAARVARAGFSKSFVSSQNRLVERHHAQYGAYWKSYDFRKGGEKGNLFQFPLGPESSSLENSKFRDLAFKHDGGEMIFHLPNGLQGYFLSNAKGDYLDRGPVDVVSDPSQRSGTAEIVNGLSCMGCHTRGLIDSIHDDVRKGASVSGEALRKVRRLYPPRESIQQLLRGDNAKFSVALEKAMGSFLSDADRARPVEAVTEPISELLMKQYNPDITLLSAALELGISSQELEAAIANSESMKDLGLRTLVSGGSIKRDTWDNGDKLTRLESDGQSLFHRVARELGLGNRRVVGR